MNNNCTPCGAQVHHQKARFLWPLFCYGFYANGVGPVVSGCILRAQQPFQCILGFPGATRNKLGNFWPLAEFHPGRRKKGFQRIFHLFIMSRNFYPQKGLKFNPSAGKIVRGTWENLKQIRKKLKTIPGTHWSHCMAIFTYIWLTLYGNVGKYAILIGHLGMFTQTWGCLERDYVSFHLLHSKPGACRPMFCNPPKN